jgi:hypothetical protein
MEKTLWKTIRDKLPNFFIQRIETQIERGIPDVHYCAAGISGWIEGKYVKTPKRNNTKIKLKLTVEQIAWHKTYNHYGGRIYVLAKKDRDVYLFLGSMSEQLAVGVSKEEFEKLAVAKGWEEIKIFLSKL